MDDADRTSPQLDQPRIAYLVQIPTDLEFAVVPPAIRLTRRLNILEGSLVKQTIYGVGLLMALAPFSAPALAATSLSNSLTGFSGDSSQGATQSALSSAGLSVFGSGAPEAVTFDGSGARFGGVTAGDDGVRVWGPKKK